MKVKEPGLHFALLLFSVYCCFSIWVMLVMFSSSSCSIRQFFHVCLVYISLFFHYFSPQSFCRFSMRVSLLMFISSVLQWMFGFHVFSTLPVFNLYCRFSIWVSLLIFNLSTCPFASSSFIFAFHIFFSTFPLQLPLSFLYEGFVNQVQFFSLSIQQFFNVIRFSSVFFFILLLFNLYYIFSIWVLLLIFH